MEHLFACCYMECDLYMGHYFYVVCHIHLTKISTAVALQWHECWKPFNFAVSEIDHIYIFT